ncbi:MAG: pitrilysin family protein [Patescibacteria group bacterium]|nr:insulinase family protein [Patescibacteria group bacterium]MBU2509522.1 insulinase family protein [Patescibacteria group bacterium]
MMQKITPSKLKNGMTAILVPQKGAVSMTIFVMIKVGSRYETRQINGASHFIEHLMFKGTKRRPSTEILTRTIDRYGAEYNAFTGKDLTAYYIKMAADKTELAIDMLHDMLFNSLYDTKEIDRERGVIVEEINMYEDNPRMHLEDLLEGVLFPKSTLGWNIAGPRDVIRKITREQLIAYRDAYYIPSRMTVVISGKIVPGAMAMLQKTFGSVKLRTEKADYDFSPFCQPKNLEDAIAIQKKNTEQTQLGLAFHGLDLHHEDLAAANLLATILGGSMSSRLFIEIRERRGLCYSISATHDPLEDTGAFSITAGLDKSRLSEAVSSILGELKRISRAPVTSEELRRAKDHIRGRIMLAFENSSVQAEWYGRQWTFLNDLKNPEEKMKQIEKVRVKDVQRVAKAILKPEKMATAVIGPYSKNDIERLIKRKTK